MLKVSCVYLQSNLVELQKILLGAAGLFMRIGIKSVSMDDIAREVGISKKTIYKHFKDKKDLVHNVVMLDLEQDKTQFTACYNTEHNAVQKMINISRNISHLHKDINPTVIYDLQKYYPSEWKNVQDFRTDFCLKSVTENIEEGVIDGYYRKDIKTQIAAHMYITLIEGMMEQLLDKNNNYNFQTLHLQMVTYHLYGICTKKGRNYLKLHINEITNQ